MRDLSICRIMGKERSMIKGRKVYDPLTDTWSTGYWVADDKGNYYPVRVERSSNGEIND